MATQTNVAVVVACMTTRMMIAVIVACVTTQMTVAVVVACMSMQTGMLGLSQCCCCYCTRVCTADVIFVYVAPVSNASRWLSVSYATYTGAETLAQCFRQNMHLSRNYNTVYLSKHCVSLRRLFLWCGCNLSRSFLTGDMSLVTCHLDAVCWQEGDRKLYCRHRFA